MAQERDGNGPPGHRAQGRRRGGPNTHATVCPWGKGTTLRAEKGDVQMVDNGDKGTGLASQSCRSRMLGQAPASGAGCPTATRDKCPSTQGSRARDTRPQGRTPSTGQWECEQKGPLPLPQPPPSSHVPIFPIPSYPMLSIYTLLHTTGQPKNEVGIRPP